MHQGRQWKNFKTFFLKKKKKLNSNANFMKKKKLLFILQLGLQGSSIIFPEYC